MAQEMNILRCYSCKMYQVHIVKKARKWQCKLCNAKQSVQQIYFQGSGKDCRFHVQQLNIAKTNEATFPVDFTEESDGNNSYDTAANVSHKLDENAVQSKWEKYLDLPKKENLSDIDDLNPENIYETEDIAPSDQLPCSNAPYCFNKNIDDYDSDFEIENVTNTYIKKEQSFINCDPNLDTTNECSSLDNSQSNKDHSSVTSIFETYSELNKPLDF